jgi:phosphomannomutase
VDNKFIFDVDGTLTPSRSGMNGEFQNFFLDFCFANDVYLVTGSDYPKTVEQIGKDVCETVVRIYNCLGNDVWEKGHNIYTNEWELPNEAVLWLTDYLKNSEFPLRTGLHFENRPGLCNFSIVGRNATMGERKLYVTWDQKQNERLSIAEDFNFMFPELQARVGGETGVDIFPKGSDKGQIVKDFKDNDILYFFGDRCDLLGNDYPLASVVKNTYHVKDWRETFQKLKHLRDTNIAL